MVAKVSNGVRA